jgi:hypothetical protein
MSRIDMNIPNTMMRNANSRRGAMRSDGGAAADIIEGGAVVASAMICSQRVRAWPERPKLFRVGHDR